MIDFKLDDGDIVMARGDIVPIEDKNELVQSAKIGTQTNQGEWFLNPLVGLDNAVILQKTPDIEAIRAEITRELLENPRIRSVEEVGISFNRSARKLDITFRATGTEGEQIESEVIPDA